MDPLEEFEIIVGNTENACNQDVVLFAKFILSFYGKKFCQVLLSVKCFKFRQINFFSFLKIKHYLFMCTNVVSPSIFQS